MGGGRSYVLVFEGKGYSCIALFTCNAYISMRAVNVTRLIRAYVKDHPLRNGESGDAFQSLGLKRTTFKLDFRTTSKPVQVLSLMDAHVVNNERGQVFAKQVLRRHWNLFSMITAAGKNRDRLMYTK